MLNKINFKNIEAVIWDWNGTLLDDVEVSILAMNQLLLKRNYPVLDAGTYKSIFTFPVKDYYAAAGVCFDTHEWKTVAMEFISNYRESVPKSGLHAPALKVLEFFRSRQTRQFILSAMEQDFLEETIAIRNIEHYFEKIVGLNNHYAATKTETAKLLVKEINLPPDRILMFGDTIHDFEVAQDAGIACVLVADGHQSCERLETTGCRVISGLGELMEIVKLW
jgi:phosphoglycolate phosphatase